ncbi:Rab-GTPase-TBC domain [Carpediemonas membranifera]|uniref:Rab-GTPase-TBC domain n=1 Tax=Carpediemonas membranifera TaxID=201153 RepID=A0A8J6DZ47_9EUKA|nr:Rab-GTPase-TBC domain [Carpediemonas membranifera]|eukprot:KAG9390233.1 Rab-GTPase-TBC domain [Carpediemonas membranifera]
MRESSATVKNEDTNDEEAAILKRERAIAFQRQHWHTTLIPNLRSGKPPSSRDIQHALIHGGVPASIRGEVWPLLVGNPLHITETLFDICLARDPDATRGQEASRNLIPTDVGRTLPELAFFQPGGTLFDSLTDVLRAFVRFRPDVGYVQGMSLIAAVFLLYSPAWQAFMLMSSIMHDGHLITFLRLDPGFVSHYMGFFDRTLKIAAPNTHSRLHRAGVPSDLFLTRWLISMFVQAVPLDTACRLWDVMLGRPDIMNLTVAAIALLIAADIPEDPDEAMARLSRRLDVDPGQLVTLFAKTVPHTIGPGRMKTLRGMLGKIVEAYT